MILGSIVAATAFYVLVILSVSVVGPWAQLVNTDLPAAAAFEHAFATEWMPDLVLVAALLGLFTSWNGFFLAGSRVIFALGRGHIVPPVFGETHPEHGTPHRAIALVGALTLSATFMGRDALVALVDAGSFCIAVAFFGVSLSLLRLRRDFPDMKRPFRLPGGRVIPVIAAMGALGMVAAMLVPGSPAALVWPHEHLVLLVMVVVGAALWFSGSTPRNLVTESERAYQVLGSELMD
jgi:amino acid transporter